MEVKIALFAIFGILLIVAAFIFGRPIPRPVLRVTAEGDGIIFDGDFHMILRLGYKVKLTATPLKVDGSPARIDGAIEWSIGADDDIVEIEPAFINDDEEQGEDPMSIWVTAVNPGVCEVTGAADVDLSEGIEEMIGFLDITVPNIEAATFAIQAGDAIPA